VNLIAIFAEFAEFGPGPSFAGPADIFANSANIAKGKRTEIAVREADVRDPRDGPQRIPDARPSVTFSVFSVASFRRADAHDHD
jgi:hypothetical protein